MKDEDLIELRGLNPAQKRLLVEVNDAAAGYFHCPYPTPGDDGLNDSLSLDEIAVALGAYLAILMANGWELLVEWAAFEGLIGAENVRWNAKLK